MTSRTHANLGLTLRLAASRAIDEGIVTRSLQRSRPGASLTPRSPGRWSVAGAAPIDRLIHATDGEDSMQSVHLLLDPASLRSRRFVGERWLLEFGASMAAQAGAQVAVMSQGGVWEELGVGALEALMLPDFDGVLFLGPEWFEATQGLASLTPWPQGVSWERLSTTVAVLSPGWLTGFSSWPGVGAPKPMPWARLPGTEAFHDAEGIEFLRVDGVGPGVEEIAAARELRAFLDATASLGVKLDPAPCVETANGGRVTITQSAWRLAILRSLVRRGVLVRGLDVLRSPPKEAAQLARRALSSVYLRAPQGTLALGWDVGEDGSRRVTLAFVGEEREEVWRGAEWQRPILERFAQSFSSLTHMGGGSSGAPPFEGSAPPSWYALVLEREGDTWRGVLQDGWFGARGVEAVEIRV